MSFRFLVFFTFSFENVLFGFGPETFPGILRKGPKKRRVWKQFSSVGSFLFIHLIMFWLLVCFFYTNSTSRNALKSKVNDATIKSCQKFIFLLLFDNKFYFGLKQSLSLSFPTTRAEVRLKQIKASVYDSDSFYAHIPKNHC